MISSPAGRSRPSASFETLLNPPQGGPDDYFPDDSDGDDSLDEAAPAPLPPSSVPSGGEIEGPAGPSGEVRRPGTSPSGITSRRGRVLPNSNDVDPAGPAQEGSDADDAGILPSKVSYICRQV